MREQEQVRGLVEREAEDARQEAPERRQMRVWLEFWGAGWRGAEEGLEGV